MNQAVFDTQPVGTEGLYMVIRKENGQVSYLASVTQPTKIAKYELGVAKAEELRLRYGHPVAADAAVWLPWSTAHLDTKKPAGMYPPARRSSYDTLGRAA